MAAAIEANASVVAQVLSAIAQLLWPVVALVLSYWLLPELKLIFHRISKSENLKIKWGDKELSVQEAADNIQKVVGSILDTEAGRGSANVSKVALEAYKPPESPSVDRQGRAIPRRILWVDDKPQGNAFETARFKEKGIQVDEVLSTSEAGRMFDQGKYALVVTNMYRRESEQANPVAGMEVLALIRRIDPGAVVIGYTRKSRVKQYGEAFLSAGGIAITSSTVELFELVDRYIPAS
jgi:RNase H-fold protein (predicted Holliday junction resolvase)